MSWTTKPYCTVDDVKLVYDKRTDTDDDLIQALLPLAQEKIDAYVGFPFQTDVGSTRTFDGNGAAQLLVDRLQTLTSVAVQTYSFTTDPVTGAVSRSANPPTDITGLVVLGPPGATPSYLLQHLTDHFPLGTRNILVTGTWGFLTVPQRVKRACELEVIAMLESRQRGYRRTYAGPTSDRATTVPDDLCAEAKELLDRFRRVRFRMG